MRSLIWLKAVNIKGLVDEGKWWLNPSKSLIQGSKAATSEWLPPNEGFAKFNVDGSFSTLAAGCGGVLRTSEGNMRAIFSGPVACEGPDFAELMAVKIALLLFIQANWVGKVLLILESDSQLALHWIMNSDSRPWRWWKDFEEIDSLVKTIDQVKFDYVPRERNCLADNLAKAGVIPRWHFKFEAAWLIEDSCEPEVQKLWVESSGFLPDRLRYMSRGLDAWFRKLKASHKFTTKSLTKRLEQLTELLPSDNVLEEMMEVKLALNLEADKSELYWEQRARANWLRYGDKNTAFFHRHASQRKRYNRICSLENENGQSCSSPDDMLHIAQEYFVSLFSSGDTADPSFILDGISHCVSDASNNFLLRPYSKVEFLPTRYCLYNRRIALDPICHVCNLANETTEHVFRDCHIACLVWTRLGFVWPQYATLLPFKEWLSWLFHSFSMNRLVLLVITLWSLWYARNKKVHEANLQTPEQICAFIVSYCRELELIASKLQLISSTQNSLWQAPDPPLVKANFDASFSSVDRASWSGVVVRNSIGEIMGACRRFSPYVASAFMAEAYAALHAIDLLVDLGFDSAVIEGDSLTIIKKLQASSSDLSELSAIIFEVQAKAKTLRNCSFNFTSRASNQVAHIIAKDFSLNSGDRFWVEEIPSSALRAAASDCRNLYPP
ncbi:hypothetical protein GQ457_11G004690 [Hibiscus cannabinus]